MKATVEGMLLAMPAPERALYTTEKLAEIRAQFTELSERWAGLKIGEGFTVAW